MINKILSLLSKLFYFVSRSERNFFEFFSFLKYRPKAFVISVGNISMGGTGKTPILFELLNEIKVSSCVLTRGYKCPWERSFYLLRGNGEHPFELTDEALMTNKRFPDVPISVGKNRHHGAIICDQKFKPKAMLLDDGFQYRRIVKDFNILLWDSMLDPGEAFTVPLGKLREPFERLSAADAILLTRCETSSADQREYWKKRITEAAPNIPLIMVKTVCDGIFNVEGERIESCERNYFAFSGIGSPKSFYAQLEQAGCKIACKKEFNDHHRFTCEELEDLNKEALSKNLQLVCTEKDYIKIPPEIASKLNLQILKIRVAAVSGKKIIDELGLSRLNNL